MKEEYSPGRTALQIRADMQEAGMAAKTIKKTPSRRGFAAMDKDRQREIARKGGASVPDEKRAFSQDRELARVAGREGGKASHGGGRPIVPK